MGVDQLWIVLRVLRTRHARGRQKRKCCGDTSETQVLR